MYNYVYVLFWLHIFSYKYSILPHHWYESYNTVHHSILDYISQSCSNHNYVIMIRELCVIYKDERAMSRDQTCHVIKHVT